MIDPEYLNDKSIIQVKKYVQKETETQVRQKKTRK